MKDLDAILPCRVTGTRLYGKPLQLIDIEKSVTILESLVSYLSSTGVVKNICLAISNEEENHGFVRIAQKHGWKYVVGYPLDVLGRVLTAIEFLDSKNILLASTENPFLYVENLEQMFTQHIEGDFDYSMASDLPEGAGVALIKADALETSHKKGSERHRSELVTSYIFDHKDDFAINVVEPKPSLKRPDVRVTVDYPEDLIFCRKVYSKFKEQNRLISIQEVINFWDEFPETRKDVENIGIDWGHGRLWD